MTQSGTTPPLVSVRPRMNRYGRRIGPAVGAAFGALVGYLLDQWAGANSKGTLALLLGCLGAVAGALAGAWVEQRLSAAEAHHRAVRHVPPARRDMLPTKIKRFTGRRVERQSLDAFYRSDVSGACLLVGMGGCGKSATIEKFIAQNHWESGIRKDDFPDALLIATFYRNTDVDAFLGWCFDVIAPLFGPEVRERFERVQGGYNPSDLGDILRALDKKVVFILDGLERIQEEKRSRLRSVGPINNPALRHLLQLAALGRCGRAKFFLTSRFDIPELGEPDGVHFIRHDLNVMREQDAIALLTLKNRVRGTPEQLQKICRDYKYHAYSLDLVANALARHFRHDARAADLIPRVEGEAMSGILTYYAARMSTDETAIMTASSAFREAVSSRLVRGLVRTPAIGRADLANATFQVACNDLRDSGLLFVENGAAGEPPTIDLHPIVRDFFKSRMLNRGDVHRAALGLETIPSEVRAQSSTEVARTAELIYQAVNAGEMELAWKLYSQSLGGYRHLGNNLGAHPRGSQVIETFFEVDQTTGLLSSAQRLRLHVDAALYLKNEGKLDDAIASLQDALTEVKAAQPQQADATTGRRLSDVAESISILDNLAGIQTLRGWTADAQLSAQAAIARIDEAEGVLDLHEVSRSRKESGSRLATTKAFRAEPDAIAVYEELHKLPYEQSHPPREVLELRFAWLCQRRGMLDRADALLADVDHVLGAHQNKMIEARAWFYRAQVLLARGRVDESWLMQEKIDAWAVRVDLEMLVATKLLAGQCFVCDGDLAAARAPLRSSLDLAGDNGFGLYWIEAQLWLAGLAFKLGDAGEARQRALQCLNGNGEEFVVAMAGASDPRVGYRWGELDAKALIAALNKQPEEIASIQTEIATLGYRSLFVRTFLAPDSAT